MQLWDCTSLFMLTVRHIMTSRSNRIYLAESQCLWSQSGSNNDVQNLIQVEYAFLTSVYMYVYVYVCDLCLRTYLVLESCGIVVVPLQTF